MLTRNDQLSFKSSRKGARKNKGKGQESKKNGNKSKSGKAAGKKKGKGSSGKGKGCKNEKSKNVPNVGRKRKILRSASSSKVSLETPSEGSGGKGEKKRTPNPKDLVKPASKANKATRDPKVKVKGTPKAKAKNSRGKGCSEKQCAKGKTEQPHSGLTQRLLDLAKHFGPFMSVRDDKFKKGIRSMLDLDTLQNCRLNIYWTRCSAAVTLLEKKTDIHHFSFNNTFVAESHKAAIAIGCAAEVATRIVQF